MTEQDQERRQKRQELLLDLLAGEAWRAVVVPTLVARQREMERRLATAKGPIDEVRTYQGAWALLEELLQRPKEFFGEREGP